MAGASSRFYSDGYKVPKYMLTLHKKTIFEHSLLSFKNFFSSEHFRFVVNGDFGSEDFVSKYCKSLKIKSYSIFNAGHVTRGQAETVMLGLTEDISQPITIFNIDTILKYSPDIYLTDCDASLDVFNALGEQWSFVEPGENNRVIRTTEKQRISNLCSNGLYSFKSAELFCNAYNVMYKCRSDIEHYIAPLYNVIIGFDKLVKYQLVDSELVINCGTPDEYKKLSGN